MTLPFNPLRAAELARQAMEDDSKMTPGPWDASRYTGPRKKWLVLSADLSWVAECGYDEIAAHAIARTRNALREMAEQLMAAVERIAQLEANAISMREYRFALEGIATDGNGNPVEKAGKL